MIWDEFLRHFRFCDEEDSGLSDEHENGYIKPRKTFWRNSKQLLNNRSAADYEDFKNYELNDVEEMYPKVCSFINLIHKQIFQA